MTYKRLTASCLDCRSELSTNNILKHIDSKQCSKKRRTETKGVCCFCSNEYSRLHKHEPFCESNPDRVKRIGKNQYTKARELGQEYIISEETRTKLRDSNIGRKHSEETIAKLRTSMSLAVKNNPESYSGGYNRGRVKTYVCSNGFKVLGKWERDFVEYCIENNIKIEQPNTGFSYHWNGERTYFPDFYLPEADKWVEIKGMQTERDLAKWESLRNVHKKDLIVLDGGIDQIRTDICAIMSGES
jgi:hypothetical protein